MRHLDHTNHRALAGILAAVDAAHLPFRDPRAEWWAAGWETRWSYAKGGVNWRSSTKASAASRKTDERILKDLENAGHVQRIVPRNKLVGVKLTFAGDRYGRAICGLPSLEQSLTHLAAIATRPGRWVPECAIDGRPWGNALLDLEDEMLPALVRQWAESNCDLHGLVCYRLTPAGSKAIGKTLATESLPMFDDALRESYFAELQTALASLKGQAAPPREIGAVPLPSSWGPSDQGRPTDEDLEAMDALLCRSPGADL